MAHEPRTLLLALDGVPLRVAERAREGGFSGWATPSALIAPFPSVTHVAFASLFEPFGVPPTHRYELRHFNVTTNEMVNFGPLAYGRDAPPWSGYIDAPHRNLALEITNYASPSLAARYELDQIEREVLASPQSLVIAYVGATDGLMHLYGDDSAGEFMGELDDRLARLRRRHLSERGGPLRVVLFSDHGCGHGSIRYATGFEQLLRDAGLRVVNRLERPGDVVAPRSGMVNYGALFLKGREHAEMAARAVAGHEAVELAAYATGPDEIEVVTGKGRGRVRWRDEGAGTQFAYDADDTDPLQLADTIVQLDAEGARDPAGYAPDEAWLAATAFGYYPDPLHRLAHALTGDRVESRASVLFSLAPNFSWGMYSALAGAWARGGHLDGTHGGLDRESSLGFYLTSDRELVAPTATRSELILAPFTAEVAAARARVRYGDEATAPPDASTR
jgi:hypothetical protein